VLVIGLGTAVAVFALALLVGWATAGTRERLGQAKPVKGTQRPPAVKVLGHVPQLPKAPPARSRAAGASTAPQVPRLIVGTG
jgi:hypothetical protein